MWGERGRWVVRERGEARKKRRNVEKEEGREMGDRKSRKDGNKLTEEITLAKKATEVVREVKNVALVDSRIVCVSFW